MNSKLKGAIGLGIAAVVFDIAAAVVFVMADAQLDAMAPSDRTALAWFSGLGGVCLLGALVLWTLGRDA